MLDCLPSFALVFLVVNSRNYGILVLSIFSCFPHLVPLTLLLGSIPSCDVVTLVVMSVFLR